MLPYWVLFLAWMAYSLTGTRSTVGTGDAIANGSRKPSLTLIVLSLATAAMMGLRFEVGGDWRSYIEMYEFAQLVQFGDMLNRTDPAFAVLLSLSATIGGGIWLVDLLCGIVMTLGIARFCARQQNPGLTFLVAVPYLVIVVGMGYTRQGVAIGLILAGIADIERKPIFYVVFYVMAAALFHKTALLVLPIILVPLLRRNLLYSLAGLGTFAVLFVVLLSGQSDRLVTNYIDADYQSSGAAIRVAMNLVPALLVVFLRKRLGFGAYSGEMWLVFAIISLGTLPLVAFASFSTAIDRLALFLIPLQLAVLPRVPYVFGRGGKANPQAMIAVIAYSAAVQLVWLVFAQHSQYWLPYQAYFLSEQS